MDKWLHKVEYSAPVQRKLHPDGKIVDSSSDREEVEEWARTFIEENPGVAASYVIPNPEYVEEVS